MGSAHRVLVSLSPDQHDTLRRIGEATDKSMSAVMRELFEASMPVLVRVAEACERAKVVKAESRQGIAAAFQAAAAAADVLSSQGKLHLEAAMQTLPGAPVVPSEQGEAGPGPVPPSGASAPAAPPGGAGPGPRAHRAAQPGPAPEAPGGGPRRGRGDPRPVITGVRIQPGKQNQGVSRSPRKPRGRG